ncbi:MAG: DUF2130 domain-containing protein [Ignavibacteriae bacterium]|nr:DUF2130 domain-containing protein [Ignavibacteriota bacterium]
MSDNKITCPECGHKFEIESAIYNQAEEKLKKEFDKKIAEQASSFNKLKLDLEKDKDDFEKKKQKENQLFKERLDKALEDEKNALSYENEKRIKETKESYEKLMNEQKIHQETIMKEQYEFKLKMLEEENENKKKENQELKEKELQLLKRESELKNKENDLRIESEKKLLEERSRIEEEVSKREKDKVELKLREYQKQIDDSNKLVDELKRKAEQGSMQMQGEVMELALEELLRREYPFDIISEIAKGVRGADVAQTVMNEFNKQCGIILYESKRTKSFSEGWLDKLKDDMKEKGANIGILVTDVMPSDMKKFGKRNGVWVCTLNEVSSLCFVLREMLIREHNMLIAQDNKGDKMSLLYNYLISEEFKNRVENIVEAFSGMKSEVEKEKNAMGKIWKEREKQLEKVISNTIDMYGSIKGIGGASIQSVKSLELPMSGEEE